MERGSCRVLGEFELFLLVFLFLGAVVGREREGERGSVIEGER